MFRFLMRALAGIFKFGAYALQFCIEVPLRTLHRMLRPHPDVEAPPDDLGVIERESVAEEFRLMAEIEADAAARAPEMPAKVVMSAAARISVWAAQRAAGKHADPAPVTLPIGYRVWANKLTEPEIKVVAKAGYKRVFEHLIRLNPIDNLPRATLTPFRHALPPKREDNVITFPAPRTAPRHEPSRSREPDADERSPRSALG